MAVTPKNLLDFSIRNSEQSQLFTMQLNHFHDTALPDRIANETKSLPIHLGNSMPAESKFPTFPENAACRVANLTGWGKGIDE